MYSYVNIKDVINLLQNKKHFFNGHPDVYRFIIDNFGTKQEAGTVVEMKVIKPSGEEVSTSMKFKETDMPFLDSVSNILSEKD